MGTVTRLRIGPKSVELVSLSKGKKDKSPRQQLLSAMMGMMSGDPGTEMAEAFAAGRTDDLRDMLEEAVKGVLRKASRNK